MVDNDATYKYETPYKGIFLISQFPLVVSSIGC